MKFTTSALTLVSLFLSASALPAPVKRQAIDRATVDRLTPDLGVARGVKNPTSADCVGFNGALIPCVCPPERATLIDQITNNLNAGRVINNPGVGALNFPLGDSLSERSARITAVLITLQNLEGPGVGCPAVSTNLIPQRQALDEGRDPGGAPAPAPAPPAAPAPPPPAAAPAPPPPPPAAGLGQVAALAPEFGHAANVNPTGTGDCDGAVLTPEGTPVKIPCACPPERGEFLRQLEANVAAGFAINNPSVAVSYAFGDSPQDQSARITASLITLQNLNGPGRGCPAASTNLLAVQRGLAA